MGWQQTLKDALDELERERRRLSSELDEVEDRIRKVEAMAALPKAPKRRGRPSGQAKAKTKRNLSAEGREAISRAAKKRWAKHRAAQKKTESKAGSSKKAPAS